MTPTTPTISGISKINTMIAVLRIPNIIIQDVKDCIPSIWPELFSALLDRLLETGNIALSTFSAIRKRVFKSKAGLEGIL